MLSKDVEDLICERPICVGTQNQYRRSVKCYSLFLGEPAQRTHLLEQTVNRWLMSLDGKKSPETIRGRKSGITAIWNWLAERGEVSHYNPNRMRKIRLEEKPPVAWSIANVKALLSGAAEVSGTLACGLKASELLTAWVWIGYESGLRPSDILRIRVEQVGDRVAIVQHKTRKPHCFQLSKQALAALEPLLQLGRDEAFGLPRSTARRWELKLFEAAEKYGFTRRRGQALGTLRKTHGTEVCRSSGLTAAAQSLGHVSGTLIARRSYVQPDAIEEPPAPPSLYDGNKRTTQRRSGDSRRRA